MDEPNIIMLLLEFGRLLLLHQIFRLRQAFPAEFEQLGRFQAAGFSHEAAEDENSCDVESGAGVEAFGGLFAE